MIIILIKVCAVLIIGVIVTVLLKEYKPEYAVTFSVCCGVFVLLLIVKDVLPQIKTLYNLFGLSDNNTYYLSVVIKSMCIAYLCEFCAETCRDFGQSSMAGKAELVGKCAVLSLCIPLIKKILETAISFCKK